MRTRQAPPRRPDDEGFTLVEMLVAVAIVSIVMLALGALFVATATGTKAQGSQQTASRLITDAMDRVHALAGSDVIKGRDAASSATQRASAMAGVTSLLTGLSSAVDTTAAAGAGASATLPTAPVTSTVDGLPYQQNWYVALCNQTTAGACLSTAGSGTVALYDVVVAVTWPSKACGVTCSQVAATLVQATTLDPQFNSNLVALPPAITAIPDRADDIGLSPSIPVTVTGGAAPVTLLATGLPPGMSLVNGIITGTLTTAIASSTVTVTATDAFGLASQVTFAWTVNPLPQLLTQAPPTSMVGTLITSLPLGVSGGTAPLTWSVTGLPAGLVSAAGVVTGIPATAGTSTVTAKVSDAFGKTSSTSFTWTVLPALKVTSPMLPTQLTVRPATVNQTLTAAGGSGGYTWSATGLPPGLSLATTTGVISGSPTTAGAYTVTATVTDSGARTASFSWVWTVQ